MAELVILVLTLTLIKLALNPSLTLAAYDPSFGINDICEARCDHHRPHGWTGSYTFGCDEFTTEEEWDDCRNDCKECVGSVVCDFAEDPNTYHCPETQITGECKEFCDLNRMNGSTETYQVQCFALENPDEAAACSRSCYTCPNYICDFLNEKTTFHCPDVSRDPPSTRKLRPPRKNTTTSRNIASSRTRPTPKLTSISRKPTAIIPTQTDKMLSPDMIPLRMKIAGRSLDNPDDNETEPEDQEQDSLVRKISGNTTGETEVTYEGPCKARCDKFRLGGTKEYDFKCDDLFETDEERDKCKLDCLKCPRKICPRKLNYVFICPKSLEHVDPLDLGPLGIVFLLTTIILAFVCVTLGAFYCCRRSRHGRLLSEEVTTSGHQIEYLHQVPQQRQKQKGNHHAPMKIVSSDSMI